MPTFTYQPPPYARSLVSSLSDRLESLARNHTEDPGLGYSLACSALHDINVVARSLELAGTPEPEIISLFERVRGIMASSPLGLHMQTWPSGQQGDFRVVEHLAAGINQAPPHSFAFDLEQAILHSGIVQQHRYKLRYQSEAVFNALLEYACRPRILSLGCGGCRDLLPLLSALRLFQGELVLNDIDPVALDLAAERLRPSTDHFRPMCANILSVVRLLRHDKPFNLIVAGGLFDYIPSRLLKHVLKSLYRDLLAPGGMLLFTNINVGNPFRPLLTYAVDWQLIERSEADIRNLCTEALVPSGFVQCVQDESQLTWIVRLAK